MQLKSLLFLISCLLYSISYAQLSGTNRTDVINEDNIFLDGVISDYYTGDNISGVKITATVNGKSFATGTSDGKGEYKMVLEYDKEYTITYSKPGLISKIIIINTAGVPDIKRQRVPDISAEITLFKPNDCIKTPMLDKPIGRANYFAEKNVIEWDMVYSRPKLSAVNEMLDECAEKIEEQKEAYNDAIKEADKLFSKENWEEAKKGYEKALGIFPNEQEPKNKINLINTELNKKAEAEKQRAEEKARAEAEALAKAEKEAAEKKAEEERLAKEKAEKEALAKAEAEKKELEKAALAAKKAEEEKLAKEQKIAEAKAKEEALEKAKLKEEAEANKLAEEKAKEEEKDALNKAKENEKAKILAKEEAEKRAEQEKEALKEKEIAEKREKEERLAKEKAAKLAEKAEKERAENQVIISEKNEEIKQEIVKQAITEKSKPAQPKGKGSITIKGSNKGRHLYTKPNKYRYGKGPRPQKHIVF
jgi:hypothetical protein